MKYNVVFWELDKKLAISMDSFINKEVDELSEKFPGLIYGRKNNTGKSYKNLIIKGVGNNFVDISFSSFNVQTEKEAMLNSMTIKNMDSNTKLLSIINIGSTYFKNFGSHTLPEECIIPEAFDYDKKIIDYLSNKDIDVLFTNCIHNFKYSKPEYMLDRVEVYDKVDSAWPTPEYSKHFESLMSHKDEIDENIFSVLYYLFTSPIINSQMFGEVIYKAVYPSYWNEYASGLDKLDIEENNKAVRTYTDLDREKSINEINNLLLGNKNVNKEQVNISLDEFITKHNEVNETRPDVDSLINDNHDILDNNKNRTRR